MAQHARDVKMKKLHNKNSYSFASHFADQLRNFETFSHKLHRNMLNCSIIWEANPHSAIKTFGTPNVSSVVEKDLRLSR
jgi:hypothetical protein